MKKHKSKRNRHTGHINFMKRCILEKGSVATDSEGNKYVEKVMKVVYNELGIPEQRRTLVRMPTDEVIN